MKKKLFINGKIYTMDKDMPIVENIVVDSTKITTLNTAVKQSELSNYEVVDLNGKTLLPGFNDSHMHLLSYGKTLDMVDLNGVASIEELKFKVKRFIEKNKIPDGKWVLGRGWNHEMFKEKRMPNRYDLDEISERHPIVLTRTCGHIRILNTKCMKISGLDKDIEIQSGKIFKDENGKPIGIFAEQGTKKLIYRNKPKLTAEEIKKYILFAADKFRKSGLTSVHTDDFEAEAQNEGFQEILDAYYEMSDEGSLPIKVNHELQLKNIEDLDILLKNNIKRNYSDYLSIGSLKIEADGCLGARTAAVEGYYEDKPNEVGVLADVQPMFVGTDWQIAEQRVGKKKCMTSYAWKSLMEAGVIVSGGSDIPVESYKPLSGIRCAVTREDENGEPKGGWNPFEKVTVYDALRMYTYNSAFAEFKEDRKGMIKEGYEADFVILEQDPYLVESDLLASIPIYGTVVNGDMSV